MLNVTLLGTGGTMPLKNRWLSSCLLSSNGHSVLIDCGEGTQIALKSAGKKCKPIDVICISHFHADHISGIPGFLLTMSNEGRTAPITFIGPKGIEHNIRSLCVIAPNLPFDMNFIEYSGHLDFKFENIRIGAFPLKHGVRCIGFTIKLLRAGKFDTEKAKGNNVPMRIWKVLQKNHIAELDGKLYTSDMVLGKPRKGIKVTYCTDTRPTELIVKNARDSDLFICEGMFGDDDKLIRAKESGHMLFSEAADIARKANVKQMWLTHYSPSLTDPEAYIENAKGKFECTECGYDGKSIDLMFENG